MYVVCVCVYEWNSIEIYIIYNILLDLSVIFIIKHVCVVCMCVHVLTIRLYTYELAV